MIAKGYKGQKIILFLQLAQQALGLVKQSCIDKPSEEGVLDSTLVFSLFAGGSHLPSHSR